MMEMPGQLDVDRMVAALVNSSANKSTYILSNIGLSSTSLSSYRAERVKPNDRIKPEQRHASMPSATRTIHF